MSRVPADGLGVDDTAANSNEPRRGQSQSIEDSTTEGEVIPRVHVRKSLTETATELLVQFDITSNCEHPLVVDLSETLADDCGIGIADIETTYEWRGSDSTQVRYERVIGPNESTHTGYAVDTSSRDAEGNPSISTRLAVQPARSSDTPEHPTTTVNRRVSPADDDLVVTDDATAPETVWQVSIRGSRMAVTNGECLDENVAPYIEVLDTNGNVTAAGRPKAEPSWNDYSSTLRDELRERSNSTSGALREPEPKADVGVLVGIPAYNEVGTIGEVVSDAREYADEVLVVDDGSSDATSTAAQLAGATVFQHGHNRGYGATLKSIFEHARKYDTDHLVVLDADGQHTPSDIPDLVDAQQNGPADLVIGSRFVDGAESNTPYYRRFGLSIINLLTNLSAGTIHPSSYIHDTQCGFRVYNRQAIDSLASNGDLGDEMTASTDIIFHAHQHGYEIEEVPTNVRYDVKNANSKNPVLHGLQLVKNILD